MSSEAGQARQAADEPPAELPSRTFVASRVQTVMPAVMAAVMLTVGPLMIGRGSSVAGGWAVGCGAFFAGIVLTLLVRPYRLELSAAGFRYLTVFGRIRSYAWDDCGLFTVARWPDGYRRVSPQGVFFHTTKRDELGRPRNSLFSRLIGATYRGIEPSELVELLNGYRGAALQQPWYE